MAGPILKHKAGDKWSILEANGASVHASYERLTRLIQVKCGADAAAHFAKPALGQDGTVIGWSSPLGGALHLPRPDQVAALTKEVERHRSAIVGLADQLASQGSAGEMAAWLIGLALTTPDDATTLYVDDGHPVLINWGLTSPDQSLTPYAPASGLGLNVAPGAQGSEAKAAPTDVGAHQRSRRFPAFLWGVPILLFLTTGFLFWQFTLPPPTKTVVVIPPAPKAYDPSGDIQARIDALDIALAKVSGVNPDFANLCLSEAQAACAAARDAPKPKELVIVLDASGSMNFSIHTPQHLEAKLDTVPQTVRVFFNLRAANPEYAKVWRDIEAVPGPSRMNITKPILERVIMEAPADTRIGAVAFNGCNNRSGFPLSPAQRRSEMVDWVNFRRPDGATDLAASISSAAQLLTGGATEDDPVNILVVSDGLDSCNGDPCAAARAAKRAKPGLRVNVIDLAGFHPLRCVAEATGGLYRSHRDGMSVAELTMITRSFAGGPTTCDE